MLSFLRSYYFFRFGEDLSRDMDTVFEQAMCDSWWIQDNGVVVQRPEITYLKSIHNLRLYNAVLRISPQYKDVEKLVYEVMEAHQGRGSEWRIGSPSYTPRLEKSVQNAGYKEDGVADAWSIDVSCSRRAASNDVYIRKVMNLQQMRDMDRVMQLSFSKPNPKENALLKQELLLCLGEKPRCFLFVAYDKCTDEPISAGGVNMFADLSFAFMWGGCTVPHARGKGAYSALVTKRMQIARAYGIERIGLYAMRDTSGPIVEAQGFDKHGPVYFWGRDNTPIVP